LKDSDVLAHKLDTALIEICDSVGAIAEQIGRLAVKFNAK